VGNVWVLPVPRSLSGQQGGRRPTPNGEEPTMTPTIRRPVHVAAASVRTALGTPWGDRIAEVVPASLTAGAFASFHVFAAGSAERPEYVPHAADEAFVVVSGTGTVEVGGQEPPAGLTAGAAVYVPRGALRSFRTGSSGAWRLVTQTPVWTSATCRHGWRIRPPIPPPPHPRTGGVWRRAGPTRSDLGRGVLAG
jgi:mannose-6-phosphate isomerase-like protein (cupin superfamily)